MPHTKSQGSATRRQRQQRAEKYTRLIKSYSNALDVYVRDESYTSTIVRKINYIQINLDKLRQIVEYKWTTAQHINWHRTRRWWREGFNAGLLGGFVGALIAVALIHFNGEVIGIAGGLAAFTVMYYLGNK